MKTNVIDNYYTIIREVSHRNWTKGGKPLLKKKMRKMDFRKIQDTCKGTKA